MKGIKLKIILILLMLIPVPFSCKEKDECLDLYAHPYYRILNMVFKNVELYWKTKEDMPMFDGISQDYDNQVYSCDSLALYFYAPDTSLMYHAQQIKSTFGFTQEAFACNTNRPGYAGTRDLVDKIYISSLYDYDETHDATMNLSDIVDILPYTPNKKETWTSLSEYNNNSPYEAPKRFYLFLKATPTRSPIQQFVIRYQMLTEEDNSSKQFIIVTPKFHVKVAN